MTFVNFLGPATRLGNCRNSSVLFTTNKAKKKASKARRKNVLSFDKYRECVFYIFIVITKKIDIDDKNYKKRTYIAILVYIIYGSVFLFSEA